MARWSVLVFMAALSSSKARTAGGGKTRRGRTSASNAASQSAADTVSCSAPRGVWRPGKVRQKTTRKQKATTSRVPLKSHAKQRRGPTVKPAAASREGSVTAGVTAGKGVGS